MPMMSDKGKKEMVGDVSSITSWKESAMHATECAEDRREEKAGRGMGGGRKRKGDQGPESGTAKVLIVRGTVMALAVAGHATKATTRRKGVPRGKEGRKG